MTTVETPEARAGIAIPDGWRELPWPALKSLAAKMTDKPVHDKADAMAAVTAEFERRAMPKTMGADLPPLPDPAPAPAQPGPGVSIPADWHETMSVADIYALARNFDPDGNPVEVIRAELARRGA